MIPNMNSKQVHDAMKKLGMQQEDIDTIAVIIRTKKEDIIIRNPSVQRINMMGQLSYQVSGEEEHRPLEEDEPEISEEDIVTVIDQTGVSKDKALGALKECKGDLAAAIISLKSK
jgi:nascent polypeptide-associated complex subunit alpha